MFADIKTVRKKEEEEKVEGEKEWEGRERQGVGGGGNLTLDWRGVSSFTKTPRIHLPLPAHTQSLSYTLKKCGINFLCLHECLFFEIESINASLSGSWHNPAWAT